MVNVKEVVGCQDDCVFDCTSEGSFIRTTPIFFETSKARSKRLKKSMPIKIVSEVIDKSVTPVSVLPAKVTRANAVSMTKEELFANVTFCVPCKGRERPIAAAKGN